MFPAGTARRRRPAPPLRALPLAVALLAACGGVARLPVASGTGPAPVLPPPAGGLLPAVSISPAAGWPAGRTPAAAAGLQVAAFAEGLAHPRWLQVLPNGDVLVAESNAPPRPEYHDGLMGWVRKQLMQRSGSATPSADRITLLRDVDADGTADARHVLLDSASGLRSPFGMALVGDTLYVANSAAVLAFPYTAGDTRVTAPPRTVVALPAGPYNQHWTRSLLASGDGRRLYVGVGSASNVGEFGMAREAGRAAVWEVDLATGAHRVYASGLRNPVGMAWEPATGALWVAVNERDGLGGDLVPDYMTAVRDGAFYGWPWSYWGAHVDERVRPRRPDLVAAAVAPDYALGPHTASLGLASSRGTSLPAPFADGMFVGQHGSWNRKPPSGFAVVFVPFQDGRPAGPPVDVLTGFRSETGHALGRPVGVALDATGALLVADDVGNVIWRVTAAPMATAAGAVTPPAR